jgi:uncharacterized lipoprotein NlpE involved in copper resistance
MKKWVLLVSVSLMISSCTRNSNSVTVVYDTIDTHLDSLDFNIVSNPIENYKGVLPCASCGGILTELSLNPDSLTYILKETYQGKIETDSVFTSNGKYSSNISENLKVMVYKLSTDKPDEFRYFKAEGDSALKMLDKQQKDFTSKLNYSLQKIK